MLTKRKKINVIKETGRHDTDTGSPEVQVGMLTKQITELTSHLKKNPKDVRVLMEMAVILEKKGDTDKAVTAYEDLLKVAPDFVPALNNLAVIRSANSFWTISTARAMTRPASAAPVIPNTRGDVSW